MATLTDPETGETVELDFDEGAPAPLAPAGDMAPATKPLNPGPAFMDADWDDEVPAVEPVFLPVDGGLPLLYAGESHMVYGTGGSGKSWFGYSGAIEVARAGFGALIVDYESNRRTVRERLKARGVTKEEAARIAYWRVVGSLMPGSPARRTLDAWIAQAEPTFVLLDSVAKAMGAAGLDESSPSQYVTWQQAVVEPWTARRLTSLLIDHVGHQDPLRNGNRPPAARGASSKKDQVSGASYFFETSEPWTRQNSGRATLTTMKDREGHRKTGSVAAQMIVDVADGAGAWT